MIIEELKETLKNNETILLHGALYKIQSITERIAKDGNGYETEIEVVALSLLYCTTVEWNDPKIFDDIYFNPITMADDLDNQKTSEDLKKCLMKYCEIAFIPKR